MFGEHCEAHVAGLSSLGEEEARWEGSSVQIWKSDFILNSLNDKADLMRSVL